MKQKEIKRGTAGLIEREINHGCFGFNPFKKVFKDKKGKVIKTRTALKRKLRFTDIIYEINFNPLNWREGLPFGQKTWKPKNK
jgi:hypothetical protein